MKDNGWRKNLDGVVNSVLGIVVTIAGIVAVLGASYLLVWLINAIAG